ncbi:ABC transporter ATP-binding protein [Cellulosilyticum ruminicola]|uniref:ABC transporter ATP-binding protein n=1 Tax=Cellulosilyticum ruminicola TaxID=425254 RepID=UPI000A50D3C3|nr:ATP-binding cassette domain-containing protein [Cellulosilyticum ruminicola]
MESYTVEHLTFTYSNGQRRSLEDISLKIKQGEIVVLCGQSGCGKTTLLRHLKTCLQPVGVCEGAVYFEGKLLQEVDKRTQSEKIGFVLQNPETQIVTDKVWHELAFGLESLGYSQLEIRTRVAEMATFFGIQSWFHKKTSELSGGQKQLLNLASIMVMQPTVLLLDEPTSQLDPIAAHDFIETVIKLNREFGTTILLTEHRLEEVFPKADRVIIMEEGHILIEDTPLQTGKKLYALEHKMFKALPEPMRIYARVNRQLQHNSNSQWLCPITVREGRNWLEAFIKEYQFQELIAPTQLEKQSALPIIELKETWFRYEKEAEDVLKALSLKVYSGETYALVGGNGTGKTTSLGIMSGVLKPYKGKVLINGKNFKQAAKDTHIVLGVLPQDPKTLFVKQTVDLELEEMLKLYKKKDMHDLLNSEIIMTKEEISEQVIAICELQHLLQQHPYDLSGGEQQRVALAKVLLLQPQILFLDEPTKGIDAYYKEKLGHILSQLKSKGMTIVMVSHDLAFCAAYADKCGMFFDGNIVSEAEPRKFCRQTFILLLLIA